MLLMLGKILKVKFWTNTELCKVHLLMFQITL